MLILTLLCLLASVNSQNYCSISSDHTMCRFGSGPGRACGKRSCGGLARNEIETILRVHNELRSAVARGNEKRGAPGPQPTAANMQTLIWDDRLAEVAQRWADQCTFQHDKCRDDPRFPVGQNIYWSSGIAESDWGRAVRQWYGEVAEMHPRLVQGYAYEQHTAHYTQLVWAQTRYVGCGRRSYGGTYRTRGSAALEHLLAEARPSNATVRLSEKNVDAELGVASDNAGSKAIQETRKPRLISDNFVEPTRMHLEILTNAQGSHPSMPKLAEKMRNRDWFYPNSSKYTPFYAYGKYTRPFSSDVFSDKKESEESSESSSSESSSSESSESSGEESDDENEKPGVTVVSPDTIVLSTWTSQGWQMYNYDWSDDQILVCNYGPSGNILGQPVYEVGRPCSKCLGTVCIDGLCA